MLRKGKCAVEGETRKSWSEIEKEAGVELEKVSLVGIHYKETSHLLGLRRRHQYSDQRSNRNRASCVDSIAVGTEGEEDQMARSSA